MLQEVARQRTDDLKAMTPDTISLGKLPTPSSLIFQMINFYQVLKNKLYKRLWILGRTRPRDSQHRARFFRGQPGVMRLATMY